VAHRVLEEIFQRDTKALHGGHQHFNLPTIFMAGVAKLLLSGTI